MVSGRLYVKVRALLENWTIDNLLGKHESRPYNPNVATVMYIMPDLSRAGAVALNKFVQHVLQMDCPTRNIPYILDNYVVSQGK